MAIPRKKGRNEQRHKEIARLQRQQVQETKDIERALRKALQYSVLVDNGDADSVHDMINCLDLAITRGMAEDAIRVGSGMTGKIKALLGHKPEAHSMALAMLETAVDLIAGIDGEASSLAEQAAERLRPLSTAETVDKWRSKVIPKQQAFVSRV